MCIVLVVVKQRIQPPQRRPPSKLQPRKSDAGFKRRMNDESRYGVLGSHYMRQWFSRSFVWIVLSYS
jgi:hypothetical protein